MFNDFRNSVNKILNERLTSPFWGTLFSSWLIWNWKIPYVTFFVSEKTVGNKIDYIISNCSNVHNLITGPLISTIVIIALVPFITNGAFWLTIIFDKWRADKRNEVDNKSRLTIEQSIQIREQMANREEWFQKQLDEKDADISKLKAEIDASYSSKINTTGGYTSNDVETISKRLTEGFNLKDIDSFFDKLISYDRIADNDKIVNKFLKFDLLNRDSRPTNTESQYSLNAKGKSVRDYFYQHLFK